MGGRGGEGGALGWLGGPLQCDIHAWQPSMMAVTLATRVLPPEADTPSVAPRRRDVQGESWARLQALMHNSMCLIRHLSSIQLF